MTDSSPSSRAAAPITGGCLGRTCLKWGADGELTSVDRLLVLERLARVDPQLKALPGRMEGDPTLCQAAQAAA